MVIIIFLGVSFFLSTIITQKDITVPYGTVVIFSGSIERVHHHDTRVPLLYTIGFIIVIIICMR